MYLYSQWKLQKPIKRCKSGIYNCRAVCVYLYPIKQFNYKETPVKCSKSIIGCLKCFLETNSWWQRDCIVRNQWTRLDGNFLMHALNYHLLQCTQNLSSKNYIVINCFSFLFYDFYSFLQTTNTAWYKS